MPSRLVGNKARCHRTRRTVTPGQPLRRPQQWITTIMNEPTRCQATALGVRCVLTKGHDGLHQHQDHRTATTWPNGWGERIRAAQITGVLGLLIPGDVIWHAGRTVQVTAVSEAWIDPPGAPGVEVDWADLAGDDLGTITGENRQLVRMRDLPSRQPGQWAEVKWDDSTATVVIKDSNHYD